MCFQLWEWIDGSGFTEKCNAKAVADLEGKMQSWVLNMLSLRWSEVIILVAAQKWDRGLSYGFGSSSPSDAVDMGVMTESMCKGE